MYTDLENTQEAEAETQRPPFPEENPSPAEEVLQNLVFSTPAERQYALQLTAELLGELDEANLSPNRAVLRAMREYALTGVLVARAMAAATPEKATPSALAGLIGATMRCMKAHNTAYAAFERATLTAPARQIPEDSPAPQDLPQDFPDTIPDAPATAPNIPTEEYPTPATLPAAAQSSTPVNTGTGFSPAAHAIAAANTFQGKSR